MSIFLPKKRLFLSFLLLALIFLLHLSCQLSRFKSKLSPEDAEFLSKVRYIIISEERKIFKEISQEERARFKEEFWKRRDPDPETEVNELKELYFSRMEEANRRFSAGRPGWLTDRGEIHILLGPPTNIEKYPMGRGPGSRPTEIWYYGFFPVFFIDRHGTGDYTRVEDNVIHIHELNKALEVARMTLRYDAEFFDFSLKLKKENEQQLIIVEIPYRNLWLKSSAEGGETILSLSLDVNDSNDQAVWNFKEDFNIKLSDEELEEKKDKTFIVRIPVEFKQGKYLINAVLFNKTGEKESKKTLEFEI